MSTEKITQVSDQEAIVEQSADSQASPKEKKVQTSTDWGSYSTIMAIGPNYVGDGAKAVLDVLVCPLVKLAEAMEVRCRDYPEAIPSGLWISDATGQTAYDWVDFVDKLFQHYHPKKSIVLDIKKRNKK